jgi:hypothetical protein
LNITSTQRFNLPTGSVQYCCVLISLDFFFWRRSLFERPNRFHAYYYLMRYGWCSRCSLISRLVMKTKTI